MARIIKLINGKWENEIPRFYFNVSAVITDPPYSVRTHRGWNAGEEQVRDCAGQLIRQRINYTPWKASDVRRFVFAMHEINVGWFACFCDNELIPAYKHAYEKIGYYPFAPVVVIQRRPRLLGDGPGSSAVYLMVARPREKKYSRWRCLPGDYISVPDHTGICCGAKPITLMVKIINDYSNRGDFILDPCAGGATTLLAAYMNDRDSIGFEQNTDTHNKAMERICRYINPRQRNLFKNSQHQPTQKEIKWTT